MGGEHPEPVANQESLPRFTTGQLPEVAKLPGSALVSLLVGLIGLAAWYLWTWSVLSSTTTVSDGEAGAVVALGLVAWAFYLTILIRQWHERRTLGLTLVLTGSVCLLALTVGFALFASLGAAITSYG